MTYMIHQKGSEIAFALEDDSLEIFDYKTDQRVKMNSSKLIEFLTESDFLKNRGYELKKIS